MTEPARQAILVLDDGTTFEGRAFGASGSTVGELVFNTSMSGYQEILTDPSYAGQIVTLTMPHIGNYGIHEADSESDGLKAAGLVIRSLSETPSSWRSEQSLDAWLKEAGVVGISDVDTRALTRHIRDRGVMQAIIAHDAPENASKWAEKLAAAPKYAAVDWVSKVACSAPCRAKLTEDGRIALTPANPGEKAQVVVLDFGVKHSILRHLLERDLDVVLMPSSSTADEIAKYAPSAVLVSNGPGDPSILDAVLETLRDVADEVPTWGICLGHQLLARAYGGTTFKLKFGHRGPNQPVRDADTERVLITSQNHGYAVSSDTLPSELRVTQINLNDRTVEAFRHKTKPVYAVQYHPEAGPGPHDAQSFFDEFADLVRSQA